MKAALQHCQVRMRRVLDYIDRHLDGDLDLETVRCCGLLEASFPRAC